MSKYKFSKALPITFFLIAVGLFFWYTNANATYKKPPPKPQTVQEQSQDQHQKQGQDQNQHQTSEANAHSDSVAQSDAAANNEGNSLSVESNYESGPADIFMVPQGHTSNCMRTYGISFGDKNGGGGIGWPFRDNSCDFDNEAADAFAAGQHKIGWWWNCQKRSSYKVFKSKGMKKEAAVNACVDKMMDLYYIPEVPKLRDRITVLESQKKTLLEERAFDKERCNEEKNRIVEGCYK